MDILKDDRKYDGSPIASFPWNMHERLLLLTTTSYSFSDAVSGEK
jgi:hypothetical protein